VICNTCVVLQITEEISQRQSVNHSNNRCRKVHRGGPTELGHIFGKSIFDRLHRIPRERPKFHYSWLLILIALVGWKEIGDYHCMRTTSKGNATTQYANLWNTTNKRIQIYNNVTLYVYFNMIRYIIEHTLRITAQMV
jgi:hypothetical protein